VSEHSGIWLSANGKEKMCNSKQTNNKRKIKEPRTRNGSREHRQLLLLDKAGNGEITQQNSSSKPASRNRATMSNADVVASLLR